MVKSTVVYRIDPDEHLECSGSIRVTIEHHIALAAATVIQHVMLVDGSGRVMLDRSMNASPGPLDAPDLSSGSYFIRALIADELITDRSTVVR